MVNFYPSGNRVLILPTAAQKETASGILIPDSAKEERPLTGMIVAVGSGTRKVDEKVLFSRIGVDEVVLEDETYVIVHEDFILGNFSE